MRLQSVDLKIEITDTPSDHQKASNSRALKLELDSIDLYKEKIKYYIEMEKRKLVSAAVKSGLKEEDVLLFL